MAVSQKNYMAVSGSGSKRTKSRVWKAICTHSHSIVTQIGRRWKPPNGSLTGEWMNKMWHTREYYSALKRKAILPHATTWMNVEALMRREIRSSQKANTIPSHFYEAPTVVKFARTETSMVVVKA